MGNSFISNTEGIFVILVSLTAILTFISKLFKPGPLQDTFKMFVSFVVAFFAGIILAILLLIGLSLVTPTHPMACIVSNSSCRYTLYYWVVMFVLSLFTLVVGILSSWGVWYYLQK